VKCPEPCYDKPSVVSAQRFLDEGLPALPNLLLSMAVRASLVGVGIWVAEKYKVKHPFLKGVAAASFIEIALLVDANRQSRLSNNTLEKNCLVPKVKTT